VLLLALGVLMGSTFLDYGVTADEGVQQRYGRRMARWYTNPGADPSASEKNNLHLYGGAFELVAQAGESVLPLGAYDSRHLVNAAFGLLGVVAAWGLGRHLAGPPGGFVSALFLVLTPTYYGHCFANPKDLPFAALYALAAWAILRATPDREQLAAPRVIVAGLAAGLAAGVRVTGVALVTFAALLWAAEAWAESGGRVPARREVMRMGLNLVLLLAVAWVAMLAVWPWAQLDPIRRPLVALRAFSHFDAMPIRFEGELVAPSDLPRRYVPKLFALTLPEFYLPAFALGALGSWLPLRRRGVDGPSARRCVETLWVASLAALPVAWTMATRTPLYNGLRHLLFVLPILAVLAAVSVAGVLRRGLPAAIRVPAIGALAASMALVAVDMIRLHPYQYAYFNRLFAGGLASAVGRYETDYWLTSYKEGAEWVRRHYSRVTLHEPVRVGAIVYVPFGYYLRPEPGGSSPFVAVAPEQSPHVLMAATSRGDQVGVRGRLLHVVERAGAPLLYVYELKPPE
jgi:hypothetical protein